MSVSRILMSICLGLTIASIGLAQTSTAEITGTIQDQSGAVVPGVKVVAASIQTGVGYVGETNGVGVYIVGSLPQGSYTLKVSKAGFRTVTLEGLILDAGDVKNQNVTLAVSGGTQTVGVSAQAITINTATPETGGTITQETIANIDVNGRSYQALASLIPGMNNVNAGSEVDPINGFAISSNGLYSNHNNMMYDGSFNMNTGCECYSPASPELDNISEVKFLTNNYSAKFGYTGGAQVLVEGKSGGKDFHGEAMEFVRNSAFDARNFFASSVNPLQQNIFGYQIGGPLYIPGRYNTAKDKTFFYWAQNWRLIRNGSSVVGSTPTVAMRNGDFSAEAARIGQPIIDPKTGSPFSNNQIPTDRIDSNAALLLNQLFPLSNYGAGGFLNYYNGTAAKNRRQQEIFRLDHELSPDLRFMGRYFQEDYYGHAPYGVFVRYQTQVFNKNAYGRLTWTPSLHIVNNLAFSFLQEIVNNFAEGPVNLTSAYSLLPAIPGQDPSRSVPDLHFSGGWTGVGVGTLIGGMDAPNVTNTLTDDASVVVGRHTLSAGLFLNFSRFSQLYSGHPQGSFTFSGTYTNDPIADFLLGDAASYNQDSRLRRGDGRYEQLEGYFQDDWKVTPHLTLNLGVRYAYIPPWYLQEATTSFSPAAYNPAYAPIVDPTTGVLTPTPNYSVTNGMVWDAEKGTNTSQGFARTLWNGWQPRVGFAWDLFGNGKTSVRGGIGRTFYRTQDLVWSTLSDPPISRSVSLFNSPLDDPAQGRSAADYPLNIIQVPYTMVPETVWSWSLSVQRELTPSTVLEIAYAGNGGRHLPLSRNANQPLPEGGYDFNPALNTNTIAVDSIRPYQGYAWIYTQYTDGTSNYNSLQVGLNHRYSRNLSFQSAYTYSKDLSKGDSFTNNMQNAYNIGADYGPVQFSRTHIFNFGFVYDLPWYKGHTGPLARLLDGWGVSGLNQIDSGFPLTANLATATAGLAGRADVVSGQPIFGSGTKTLQKWFNTAAFQAPRYGFFGNAANGTIKGPGLWNLDLTVRKVTPIAGERVRAEIRAEFYNALNHTNFSSVDTSFGSGSFGQVNWALDPRILEFGFKLLF